jgi:hypothetical protein
MTWEERVQAVESHGFTTRQAGFLTTVMLHSGVCLDRHYCTYAGIRHGQKSHDFFARLLAKKMATARSCGHNRALIIHLHSRSLYEAIGDADSRHRKPMALARAIERLMVLDAILDDRTLTWLGTERDKVTHFTVTQPVSREELPSVTYRGESSSTVRYFVDKLPIGVSRDSRSTVFLYLMTRPSPIEFRAFLEHHADLLRALPAWTVRLQVPQHLAQARGTYATAFVEQLGMPLRPDTRDELAWYLETRRTGLDTRHDRFRRAVEAFAAPRFQALYRVWQERGDSVVRASVSPALADALARRVGQLECRILTHRYRHLSSLLATA